MVTRNRYQLKHIDKEEIYDFNGSLVHFLFLHTYQFFILVYGPNHVLSGCRMNELLKGHH